jgi:hypothetical protein
MSGFVKVYSSILDSSVWGESLATRVVWITMLAMADRNGFVEASSDGIARAANLPLKQSDAALEVLSSPDIRSKTQNDEHDGRRVTRCDGGYRILNYLKYREMQTHKQKVDSERQRRHRALKRDVTHVSRTVTPQSHDVALKAEAEADTKAVTTKATTLVADAPKPKKSTWITEGVHWWAANVGTVSEPRFGKALKDCVVAHGWPKVFEALKCYAADAKARGKGARPEWFASELVKWLEWANMPATDENGDLTARGRAIVGGGA